MSGGAPLVPSLMPLCQVQEVQFEVFKEEQIKAYAVCCIDRAKSYEGGEPVRGGINDLRMGCTDFDHKCATCKLSHPDCPGHFGYVELAEKLFNIGLFDVLLLVLKCVCKNCGALLVDTKDPGVLSACSHLSGILRLRMVAKLSGRRCREKEKFVNGKSDGIEGCGETQPAIGRFSGIYPGLQVRATDKDQDQVWYGSTVYRILELVKHEDAVFMGFQPDFCHPKDLLLSVLPVPPPQVRPAVAFGSAKSDDELTHQILAIIKRNNQLKVDLDSGVEAAIIRSRSLLQESVSSYFNNASTFYKPVKVTDTKPLKSLTERLKGKYGRLRGNLMGKRVDFSARTVITGDPNIDVDEVGVPFSIAMTLTFPERVNVLNKKRLTECVRRTTYPSANYIFHPNGSITKLGLKKNREDVHLSIGDVVERHVINGDVVLFNRQPTLHRMSMMGHRVRVLSYNTFRLNLSCTTPYNADFDGDEMNLHVPQSLLTKSELIEMMMVPKNFVSPNKSAPCMGIVQDSLLGSYRITDKDTFLDKYFVQSVALWLNIWELPIPAILKPEPLWTGKQVFSLALPEVNHPAMTYATPPFPHDDKQMMIKKGKLLIGAITKGVVGAAPGSLIHVIFNERGSDEVMKFINGVQRITAFFLLNFAFSVGVQDTVAEADTMNEMNTILVKTRREVEEIGAAANDGKLTRKAGMTLLQSFEADVNSALNKCREEAAKKALSNVGRTNSFKVMIEAGSKGTDLNICQIAVFVGQQNVAGSRIPFGFRRRTLPHFMLDDYGETSRGMATRGYVEGLKPYEFFFHTMAGREGLIDTAVKTSDTGYLQRKLIKALEDIHASYDGTVRNADGELIQLIYGEDGLDGARIEGNQVFPIVHMSDSELKQTYRYEYEEDGRFTSNVGGNYMLPEVKRLLAHNPENVRILQSEFDQLMHDRDTARKILDMDEKSKMKMNLPVNVGREIHNAIVTMGTRSEVSNLNPVNVVKTVRNLQEDLMKLFPSYHRDAATGGFTNLLAQHRVERALTLFHLHLRQTLGSKRVLEEYKLSEYAFHHLIKEIRSKYQQALITPGEMIGVIAAQSCGEPATQMTLNTFHNAGISSKNVTLGVPRLLELLNVSRHQKNASLVIHLTPKWSHSDNATKAQHLIAYCTLGSITNTIQIVFDPDPHQTVVEEDEDILLAEEQVMNLDDDDDDDENSGHRGGPGGAGGEGSEGAPSPFIARLILDGAAFADKDLNMSQVKQAIRHVTPDYIIQANMENKSGSKRIVRLRPIRFLAEDSVPQLLQDIPKLLSEVHLLGIPGVQKAFLRKVSQFTVEPDKSIKSSRVQAIDTEGTALKRIFVGVLDKQNENIVDFTKTSSNKVTEVISVLGIEAGRRKLLQELREAYMAYGLNINYRHYSILVDTMCQRGYMMAISRSGINRSTMCGPLMRCSFEETVKVLMAAAAFGENDPVRGVSANLILGNQAKIGTGLFDLILDMGKLQESVPQDKSVAPGKNVNVYHGPASVVDVPSALPPGHYQGSGVDATPLLNAASQFYRREGDSVSSVGPYTSQSMLYGSGVGEVSTIHPTQTDQLGRGGLLQSTEMYSSLHDGGYSASASVESAYQPVSSSLCHSSIPYDEEGTDALAPHTGGSIPTTTADMPYSEAYSVLSSFHLQSGSASLPYALSQTEEEAEDSFSATSSSRGGPSHPANSYKAPPPPPQGDNIHGVPLEVGAEAEEMSRQSGVSHASAPYYGYEEEEGSNEPTG